MSSRATKTDVWFELQHGRYEPAKAIVVDAITRARGNLRRASWMLDVSRMQLYRWIQRFELAPIVLAERKRVDEKIRATRDRLAPMDELLQEVVEACAGKSADEIAELIEASPLAKELSDPHKVAAYIASLAGG